MSYHGDERPIDLQVNPTLIDGSFKRNKDKKKLSSRVHDFMSVRPQVRRHSSRRSEKKWLDTYLPMQ